MERWQPYREMLSLRDAMDRLFQESFVNYPGRPGQGTSMMPISVDVHETEHGYELVAVLPGWKPEDINITVHGDTVTISGQHRADQRQDEGKTYHLRERRFGSFSRSFSFPTPIDTSQAQARYENGELVLTIPKAEQARPRRIPIAGQAGRQMGGTPQPGTTGQVGGQPTGQVGGQPTGQMPSPARQPAGAAGRGQGGQGGQGTGGAQVPVEGQGSGQSGRGRTRKSGRT
ncbi:MAG TPA: Hsp20/alpha crystallin family protein [Chloroflexota bacterium]|jgi:HSP20 family protein|nr:Hsp20/alpha crystallin family protein [Chloroflexota bacterium]